MIEKRLSTANNLLLTIIKLTEQGIADIREARKDRLDSQNKEKLDALNAFLKEKKALDMALLDLANKNNGNLTDVLSEKTNDLLQQLRFNLNYLLAKNKEYARYVLSVKEFYDSMLEEMLKDSIEVNGYKQEYKNTSTLNQTL
ncbi:flagellar biosynthesis protein FlgN [Campylobacter sp. Cr9]|uniref:flagellar biosynthesis protein FlgN n=1 Tax=unclassified Campylobacter TaxID=2593542 RepID=UPI001EFB93E5|nr:flagellar biosynthesis protein FlgN [Campylobacter sp. RM5004]MBZ7984792.1 flagellar biosynthesis protein FlgN [Campylobacter sp. Cr9]ULO02072.1 flagellar FlgK/FlgL chaperone FlgN [Campylobacter sp. RM5004]